MKISLSEGFYFRTKCKSCQSGPEYFLLVLDGDINHGNFISIKQANSFIKTCVKANSSHKLEYFTNVRSMSLSYMFSTNIQSKLNTKIPGINHQKELDRINFIAECYCGKTSWGYNIPERDHTEHRKANKYINVKNFKSITV